MTKPARNYLVYRHGSNAANQSMCEKMPVAIVEADSAAEACDASGEDAHCYNNQWLSAVAEYHAPAADWDSVLYGVAVPRMGD